MCTEYSEMDAHRGYDEGSDSDSDSDTDVIANMLKMLKKKPASSSEASPMGATSVLDHAPRPSTVSRVASPSLNTMASCARVGYAPCTVACNYTLPNTKWTHVAEATRGVSHICKDGYHTAD